MEVITDRAPTYPRVLDALWPAAWHHVERYANNRVEADHAQLKDRLRPMRGIKTMTALQVLAAGHGFVQNLRRRHYEIAAEQPSTVSQRRSASWPSNLTSHLDDQACSTRPTVEQCNRPAKVI